MRRRLAAVVALVAGAATIALALAVAVSEFPRGLAVLACVLLAGAAAWYGVLRTGPARIAGLTVAGLALAGAVALVVVGGGRFVDLLVLAAFLVSLAAARAALAVHVDLPGAPDPQHPVLFFNPKSGGGKAERFQLADEARKRGIEPIELGPPWDLEALVRGALDRGADALSMAGGDGSQAIVAAIAAERGLPYACIPAGTRNHFALDLGVDRDDVVGALDAFVDGGERVVDLAEVNGRVFVNNVSLGLYAEAVQRQEYRDAKIRTLLDTVPDVLGPDSTEKLDLRSRGPGGQDAPPARWCWSPTTATGSARDRLGHAAADRRRPAGASRPSPNRAGAASAADRRSARWRAWSAPTFEVDADRPIAAGIDGEALMLDAPLTFRIRPGVLRVRVARKHPGASPSAMVPDGPWDGVIELARIALGRGQETATHDEGGRMDLIEITENERLSREHAAARLHALADMLAKHNDVEFERGSLRFKVHVPDEVDFKLEIEIEDDERELEVESNGDRTCFRPTGRKDMVIAADYPFLDILWTMLISSSCG